MNCQIDLCIIIEREKHNPPKPSKLTKDKLKTMILKREYSKFIKMQWNKCI